MVFISTFCFTGINFFYKVFHLFICLCVCIGVHVFISMCICVYVWCNVFWTLSLFLDRGEDCSADADLHPGIETDRCDHYVQILWEVGRRRHDGTEDNVCQIQNRRYTLIYVPLNLCIHGYYLNRRIRRYSHVLRLESSIHPATDQGNYI